MSKEDNSKIHEKSYSKFLQYLNNFFYSRVKWGIGARPQDGQFWRMPKLIFFLQIKKIQKNLLIVNGTKNRT